MKSRLGWAVLCVVTSVLTTGCDSECSSAADCVEDDRPAPEGQEFACVDNGCVLRDIDEPEPETDAGQDVDAGEDADAGEDPDAGEETGTLTKGEVCTRGSECVPGLFCEAGSDAGTESTCQALWIAYTVGANGAARASAARWDDPTSHMTLGADAVSRWPRFDPNGDSVAYQRGDTAPELVRINRPFSAAEETVLIDAADAGTDAFVHLEWANGPDLLWTRETMGSLSGIMRVSPAGGVPEEVNDTGVFPTWQGSSIVFSSAAQGLLISDGTNATPIAGGEDGIEPQTNESNELVAYRRTTGTETIGGVVTELDELWTLPSSGGTPTQVAAVSSTDMTTHTESSFIASHTWSPNGVLLAYVRAWYSVNATTGVALLCGSAGNVECTRAANEIMIASAVATPGTESQLVDNATLPSFSPDGRYVSYVQGGRLYVQEIDPMSGAAVGQAIAHTTGGVETNQGDDSRPRWQPKP